MTFKMDRRTFLQGTSVAALSTMLPVAAEAVPAKAVAVVPAKGGSNTLPSGAAGFNGGRSQVNLNFLQIGGDFPFLNCLKTAQSWTFIDNSGPADPSALDRDGYPTSISHGGVYTV